MKVGVIGCGVVGETVAQWLEKRWHSVARHDPPKGMLDSLDECEAAFICVPTDFDGNQSDMSIVYEAASCLRGRKNVIVKSTVLPGTTCFLQKTYPQHTFFFIPEFLSEDSAATDYAAPLVSMVGVTVWDRLDSFQRQLATAQVQRLRDDNLIGRHYRTIVQSTVAEFYKLMRNAYLATKVIFFNEMYDLCTRDKIDFGVIRDLARADPWIGGEHTDPTHKGYRGYGGKCFPKDVSAILAYARERGVDLELLSAAQQVNVVRYQYASLA